MLVNDDLTVEDWNACLLFTEGSPNLLGEGGLKQRLTLQHQKRGKSTCIQPASLILQFCCHFPTPPLVS
jgi:hypothetical protein